MHIERLYAEGFRNLAPLDWRPHPRVQLLTGDNGQGKTNILEAIYVAAGLRSFRTSKLADCVGFGADKATVALELVRAQVPECCSTHPHIRPKEVNKTAGLR